MSGVTTPSSYLTVYYNGPVLLSMCAFFLLGPGLKFFTRTLSPSENCRSFLLLSWCTFCAPCWTSTRCQSSGRIRSNRVRRRRLSSNSAGVTPLVWGVDLYANKNLLSLVCMVPPNPSNFFIPLENTDRSLH